jgi:hypothetical protein
MLTTVGELLKKLEKVDPEMFAFAYREDENGTHFLGIDDVSVATGTVVRNDETAKPGLTFSPGPVKRLLIRIEND